VAVRPPRAKGERAEFHIAEQESRRSRTDRSCLRLLSTILVATKNGSDIGQRTSRAAGFALIQDNDPLVRVAVQFSPTFRSRL
jgi:hypothetical protein